MDIKKVLRQDWPWARDKLYDLVKEGAITRDEEDRFRQLMINLHNRPQFWVPDSWNADWELLPDALQLHILSFIQDTPCERQQLADDDPEGYGVETSRDYYMLDSLKNLRSVNKAFHNHFKWVSKVMRDNEITPKVSLAVYLIVSHLHSVYALDRRVDLEEAIGSSLNLEVADPTDTELYIQAFRRNVLHYLPLLQKEHRDRLCGRLADVFGASHTDENAAGELTGMLLDEHAKYEAANP